MPKYIIKGIIIIDWQATDIMFCLTNLETKLIQGKVKLKSCIPVINIEDTTTRLSYNGVPIEEGIEIIIK